MEKLNKKILLIEATKNKDFSENSQNFYKGSVLGDEYYNLDEARLRMFGGSSNHWAGWCRSLEKYDYENKNYADTKWPINKSDLIKFEERAEEILELDKKENDININENFKQVFFQSSPPVNFNTKYLDKVIKSKNIFLLIETTIYNFNLEHDNIVSAEGFYKDKSKCFLKEKFFFMLWWNRKLSNIIIFE